MKRGRPSLRLASSTLLHSLFIFFAMASNLFGRLLGKVWASGLPSVHVSACSRTREYPSHASRTSASREKEGKERKRGCISVASPMLPRTLEDTKVDATKEPRRVVFVVCSHAEAIQRTLFSRLARSESKFPVRADLEQPVSESLQPQIDCFDAAFSLHSTFLSFLLSLSLSPTPSTSNKQ